MKKILFSGLFALAILATAGYGVNKSLNAEKAGLSQLGMANLAALAGENGGTTGENGSFFSNGKKWDTDKHYYNIVGSNWFPDRQVRNNITRETGSAKWDNGNMGLGYGPISGSSGSGSSSYDKTTWTENQERVVCIDGSGNCVNGEEDWQPYY